MKPAAAVLALLLVSTTAAAFDPTVRRGSRIAILDVAKPFEHSAERSVARGIRTRLAHELAERGFDAYTTRWTYEDLSDERDRDADYYVELVSSDAYDRPYGGVGILGRNVSLEVGMVVARVAAHIRVYDGRTLELIETHQLARRKTAVVPTAVGGGIGHLYAFIALPIMRSNMYRSAERAVARESAALIAGEIDGSADRPDDGRS